MRFYRFMKALGILSCIGVGAISFLTLSDATSNAGSLDGVVTIIYLAFQLILSVILFLAFIEFQWVLAHIQLLESWVGLGLFQIYLSVTTLSKVNCSSSYKDSTPTTAVCCLLAGIGVFFAVFGCLGGKRYTKRKAQQENVQMAEP